MMTPVKDNVTITNSRIAYSVNLWCYLTVEFVIGIVISCILNILYNIKSILPKPPRDLTGDIVLVAGASSRLGEYLANEFASNGCSVICIDNDRRSVEKVAVNLRSRYCKLKEIGPDYRKHENIQSAGPMITAYKCDLLDRNAIRELATKIFEEFGGLNILVTCAGNPNQDIFDTASTTLMSHYWITMSFLPLMILPDKAYIVGITPVASNHDAYLGTRAAVAGLMGCLGQELNNRDRHLTFLSMSPIAKHISTKEAEQEVAEKVVQAVKRDQSSINITWNSKMLYQISCAIYNAITVVTQWFHTQECDYPLNPVLAHGA